MSDNGSGRLPVALRSGEVAGHTTASLRAYDRLRRRTLEDARRRGGERAEAEAAIGYDMACIQLGMQAEKHAIESGVSPEVIAEYKARLANRLAGREPDAEAADAAPAAGGAGESGRDDPPPASE